MKNRFIFNGDRLTDDNIKEHTLFCGCFDEVCKEIEYFLNNGIIEIEIRDKELQNKYIIKDRIDYSEFIDTYYE